MRLRIKNEWRVMYLCCVNVTTFTN